MTLAHSSGNLVAPSVLNSAYKLDALNEPWMEKTLTTNPIRRT